jgi:MFS family permease
MGVGSVCGALTAGARGRVSPRLLTVAAGGFGTAMLLAALAPTFALQALLLVPVGALSVTFAAGINSALQLTVTPEMRGRVMALYSVVFIGSTPIGGPVTGWLAGAAGPRAGLVLGGIAALVAGVVAQRAFVRGGAIAPRPAEPEVALVTAGGSASWRRRAAGGKSMHRRGLSIGLRHRVSDSSCTSNYFHQQQRSTDVRHRHDDHHPARRHLER